MGLGELGLCVQVSWGSGRGGSSGAGGSSLYRELSVRGRSRSRGSGCTEIPDVEADTQWGGVQVWRVREGLGAWCEVWHRRPGMGGLDS